MTTSLRHTSTFLPFPPSPCPQDVRAEPWKLPPPFAWKDCDLTDPAMLSDVYTLLTNNYVEDDDNLFRFDYSREFLRWALCSPGWRAEWTIGVVDERTGKMFAFISAIPVEIRARAHTMKMAEVNFLCIHKKLRSRRLAPVLIKEITRRVNLTGVWQAVYTSGTVIPKPVGSARYFHRLLNPKKLVQVQFTRLQRHDTMARFVKRHRLKEHPTTPHWREMVEGDVADVARLLMSELGKTQLAPTWTEEEVRHWLLPRAGVVYSYVVCPPSGEGVTDMISFYSLPSTVLGNNIHPTLSAAFLFYAGGKMNRQELVEDALVVARDLGFDVFNALNIMDNEAFLGKLLFGAGDGSLHYYLYNWYVQGGTKETPPLAASDIGLLIL